MEHGETQKKMVHGLEWSVNCKKGQLILVSYLVFIKEIIPKYQVQTYLGMVPLSVTLERSKAITFSFPIDNLNAILAIKNPSDDSSLTWNH